MCSCHTQKSSITVFVANINKPGLLESLSTMNLVLINVRKYFQFI